MKFKRIAESFCNTFDLHKAIIGLENRFFVFLDSRFTQDLLLSPYLSFISLFYLDLYVLGDDALIS